MGGVLRPDTIAREPDVRTDCTVRDDVRAALRARIEQMELLAA